jgi:hypothetical protein
MIKRLLIPVLIAASLAGPPASAGATQDRIVAELREQGFTRIEIARTLLGRTRIVAVSPAYRREIVFNPATGVILRDFWSARSAGGTGSSDIFRIGGDDDDDNAGRGSGNAGRVSDDDDDDDDDDRDDDDDDGSDDDDDD